MTIAQIHSLTREQKDKLFAATIARVLYYEHKRNHYADLAKKLYRELTGKEMA